MTKRLDGSIFDRVQNRLDYEMAIVQAYTSCRHLTKQIAQTYGVTPRTVQRIVNKHQAGRTQAEGSRVAGPLAPKHRIAGGHVSRRPGKARFNQLRNLRIVVVQMLEEMGRDFSRCEQCGKNLPEGRYELHHTRYDGATIYDLEIICKQCNLLPKNQYLD